MLGLFGFLAKVLVISSYAAVCGDVFRICRHPTKKLHLIGSNYTVHKVLRADCVSPRAGLDVQVFRLSQHIYAIAACEQDDYQCERESSHGGCMRSKFSDMVVEVELSPARDSEWRCKLVIRCALRLRVQQQYRPSGRYCLTDPKSSVILFDRTTAALVGAARRV
jgi:hypothetical protein